MVDYEGARCYMGHPLEIASEGYGVCVNSIGLWYAWSFTERDFPIWAPEFILGQDGNPIDAWVSEVCTSKQEALTIIQKDIDAYRALPFDEDRERERLMPV